jgi:threonine synthase
MGLPIRKLICASNRNHILTDFFRTGVYDTNREFHKTSSPSMDILVSSNLERFLFEVTGHDAGRVRGWFEQLKRTGRFEVDGAARRAMAALIVPGWADELRVFAVIGETFRKTGYVLDTHTAVAVAVSEEAGAAGDGVPMIIASTANPYKFSSDVLAAISGEPPDDEFRSIERLHELTGLPVHRAVRGLREKLVRHRKVIEISGMREAVLEIADGIGAAH